MVAAVLHVARTEQIKYRGLSEQPNDSRVGTNSYYIKLCEQIMSGQLL